MSTSSIVLRNSSSSRLLSRTISNAAAFSRIRHFSSFRKLALPAEDSSTPRSSNQSKSRQLDPVERRKAADREQWIKDLNEAIPNWSSPRPAIPRRLKFNNDDGANAFGIKVDPQENTISASSTEQDLSPSTSNTDNVSNEEISSIAGNILSTPLAPMPTRNIPLYEAKTSVQAFAEKANALDYDLNLSSRVAYRIPVSTGTGSKETELTRSLQSLSARTVQNRVQLRLNRQRFHERPGLKRKRLKKERWRRHFSDAFRTICARVGRLSRQGW